MALAIVLSRASLGLDAPQVTVEVHISGGLPAFSIVGLPETAVRESRERVRSAILNSRYEFPPSRITVNLAPADLPKSGGRFDLAIALGILVATGQLKTKALDQWEFLAELALSGELRPVTGILPGIMAASRASRSSIVSRANADEAGLLKKNDNRLAGHLLEVCAFLQGEGELDSPAEPPDTSVTESAGFSDIIGQHHARRALVLAACGGHNLLFRGSPGTGKTLLASRFPSLLPPLHHDQTMEVAALRSISGKATVQGNMRRPPYRAPHHTASAVAMVGGGSTLNPGEISLAHHGVLFLDELPEFSPKVLEVLREPLESGEIVISRAAYQVRLPARFQLIAAMNPCPCGYYGDRERECRCAVAAINKYQQRISGPLLDRIDLHVEVPRLKREEQEELMQAASTNPDDTKYLREQIAECRMLQLERQGVLNAHLDNKGLLNVCEIGKAEKTLLQNMMQKFQLSMRAYYKILKTGRTLADLEGKEKVVKQHLLEAASFR